jgi:hypothetical protein
MHTAEAECAEICPYILIYHILYRTGHITVSRHLRPPLGEARASATPSIGAGGLRPKPDFADAVRVTLELLEAMQKPDGPE